MQINQALKGDKLSIFQFVPECGHFKLRPGISFHFYSSHTPCGDASIFLKEEELSDIGNCILKSDDDFCITNEDGADNQNAMDMTNASNGLKRSYNGDDSEATTMSKKQKTDIHRTGAKCVPNECKQDPRLPGSDYHVLGAVRTKPGRGDPTLSVSCSDKLMRWNCVGIQVNLFLMKLSPLIF